MIVRRVKKEDLKEYAKLRLALWPSHTLEELIEECLALLRQGDEYPLYVVETCQGDMCGMIEVTSHKEAPGSSGKPIAYIEGWFVTPDMRNKGLGKLLVDKAEAWARDKGYRQMASDTNSDYPVSPAAHRALGYKETSKPLHYIKEL